MSKFIPKSAPPPSRESPVESPTPAGPLDEHWSVSRKGLIAWIAGLSLVTVYALKGGFLGIFDWANLAFHEFGHPFFGLFSNALMVYGGTIAQLFFPAAVVASFAKRRELGSVAFGIWWFGENLLNVGWYMSDAIDRVIPTTTGENDWEIIFTRWNVLEHCTQIGGFVRGVGWLFMLGAIALVAGRLFGFDRLRALAKKG